VMTPQQAASYRCAMVLAEQDYTEQKHQHDETQAHVWLNLTAPGDKRQRSICQFCTAIRLDPILRVEGEAR